MATNWQGALAGGLGGAGSGAAIGSAFPVIGTGIGAGAGGVLGFLSGLFGNRGQSKFKRPPATPQEQSAMDLLLNQGSQNLRDPYAGFEPIRQNITKNFNENILPSIAERFAGLGGLGNPAFAQERASASAQTNDLLAQLQAQFGQQNQNNGLKQLQLGLAPMNNQLYQPDGPGLGEQILGSAPGFLQAAGSIGRANQLKKLYDLIKNQQSGDGQTGLKGQPIQWQGAQANTVGMQQNMQPGNILQSILGNPTLLQQLMARG